MPESFPNDFSQSAVGDIAAQYLLIAGQPTQDRRIDWGLSGGDANHPGGSGTGPFINGILESDTQIVTHNLGVTPQAIAFGNAYTDGGRFVTFLNTGVAITDTTFGIFVRDMTGAAHGPGNLANVFFWIAIG